MKSVVYSSKVDGIKDSILNIFIAYIFSNKLFQILLVLANSTFNCNPL